MISNLVISWIEGWHALFLYDFRDCGPICPDNIPKTTLPPKERDPNVSVQDCNTTATLANPWCPCHGQSSCSTAFRKTEILHQVLQKRRGNPGSTKATYDPWSWYTMMYEGNLDWTQHQSKLVEEFKVISIICERWGFRSARPWKIHLSSIALLCNSLMEWVPIHCREWMLSNHQLTAGKPTLELGWFAWFTREHKFPHNSTYKTERNSGPLLQKMFTVHDDVCHILQTPTLRSAPGCPGPSCQLVALSARQGGKSHDAMVRGEKHITGKSPFL